MKHIKEYLELLIDDRYIISDIYSDDDYVFCSLSTWMERGSGEYTFEYCLNSFEDIFSDFKKYKLNKSNK